MDQQTQPTHENQRRRMAIHSVLNPDEDTRTARSQPSRESSVGVSSRTTTPITSSTCPDQNHGDENDARCDQLTSKKKSTSSGIIASTSEWTGETSRPPTMPNSPNDSAKDSRASSASTIDAAKRTAFRECESEIEQLRPTSRTVCAAGSLDFGIRGCVHNVRVILSPRPKCI
ncbi:hypothetical protein MMC11_002307 [Xylographa trunciseda]|nr:hypothetical protein [Xylographa trunciseda]